MMLQARPAPVVSGLCGPLVVRCRVSLPETRLVRDGEP
jgi:hypothetical protein